MRVKEERGTPEHFWAFVDRGAPDDCWEWLGYRHHSTGGYGLYHDAAGRTVRAHRYALGLVGEPLLRGQYACHHCDNPPCVNPSHLFVGAPKDNAHDMLAKGRSRSGVHQAQRTHCPAGHAYDEENTYRTRDGKCMCRECMRNRTRAWRAANLKPDAGHWSANRTHCKHGHEFTPQNTRVDGGTRHCRSCERERAARWRARRAEAIAQACEQGATLDELRAASGAVRDSEAGS